MRRRPTRRSRARRPRSRTPIAPRPTRPASPRCRHAVTRPGPPSPVSMPNDRRWSGTPGGGTTPSECSRSCRSSIARPAPGPRRHPPPPRCSGLPRRCPRWTPILPTWRMRCGRCWARSRRRSPRSRPCPACSGLPTGPRSPRSSRAMRRPPRRVRRRRSRSGARCSRRNGLPPRASLRRSPSGPRHSLARDPRRWPQPPRRPSGPRADASAVDLLASLDEERAAGERVRAVVAARLGERCRPARGDAPRRGGVRRLRLDGPPGPGVARRSGR